MITSPFSSNSLKLRTFITKIFLLFQSVVLCSTACHRVFQSLLFFHRARHYFFSFVKNLCRTCSFAMRFWWPFQRVLRICRTWSWQLSNTITFKKLEKHHSPHFSVSSRCCNYLVFGKVFIDNSCAFMMLHTCSIDATAYGPAGPLRLSASWPVSVLIVVDAPASHSSQSIIPSRAWPNAALAAQNASSRGEGLAL